MKQPAPAAAVQKAKQKATILIDFDKCKGCELCVAACPLGLIVMSPKINKLAAHPAQGVGLEKCTGCTLCARVCPDWAIEVIKYD